MDIFPFSLSLSLFLLCLKCYLYVRCALLRWHFCALLIISSIDNTQMVDYARLVREPSFDVRPEKHPAFKIRSSRARCLQEGLSGIIRIICPPPSPELLCTLRIDSRDCLRTRIEIVQRGSTGCDWLPLFRFPACRMFCRRQRLDDKLTNPADYFPVSRLDGRLN